MSDQPTNKKDKLIESLEVALDQEPSFSSGTMALPPDSFTLFYRDPVTHDARCMDLCNATEDQLKHLSDTCAIATFGRKNEDVLDESYRKARKLDCKDFACHFDAERSGLARAAYGQILSGGRGTRPVKVELYKLNVYGPGSFFKAHQDTPRANNMFGSLVVVFPTMHEGGALSLRPDGEDETVLDCGEWLRNSVIPSVAYVSFFSDVKHEVYQVEKGYRVTLTYNLYYGKSASATNQDAIPKEITSHVTDLSQNVTRDFSELLADETFLPEGGILGFGLRYQYAIGHSSYHKLANILQYLKGSDALIHRLLTMNGFDAEMVMIYEFFSYEIMTPRIIGGLDTVDEDYLHRLVREIDGTIISTSDDSKWAQERVEEEVCWITARSDSVNSSSIDYGTYGNEPGIGTSYGSVSMIARVGPPGKRAVRE